MTQKKRSFSASDLVHIFAKKHGFEDKLFAFEVKKFFSEYLDKALFSEIKQVDFHKGVLTIKIESVMLKNDFYLRKQFYLDKLNSKFGENTFKSIIIC